ncbi:chromophore lyase CpcT/CpeT [Nodosilinea sp. LEGE 07088]|uniref:chromophore lyase CpcT/CpeT n=1 Tax=Nodosilinea sp. LEGE 07088 TaxID=2777968 RepID=UPI0018816501|nr:chromophore lyase CpcT/CpeT [Nodosilinea sp. LEGE 07088]MBE9136108.1 chromophore lyase CpcT/CpeT [Nodosilinea sp. LEGE 07088]
MLEAQLEQLATYLAGEFDNRQQSLAEPIWYLHLRLWHRPLPRALFGQGYSFFIEQVSVASGSAPYRQRILHLSDRNYQLWGQYYGLVDPVAYSGGATDPARLASLTRADLVDLPTCGVSIEYQPDRETFSARLPDDSLCSFTIDGTTTYVRLRFEVGPGTSTPGSPVVFQMSDRGVDPATGKATWGPQMGPFRLLKQVAFDLPG